MHLARISDQINRSEFIRNAVSVDRPERRRSGNEDRLARSNEGSGGADAASFIRGQERSSESQGYSGRVRRRGGRGRRGEQNAGGDSADAGSDQTTTPPSESTTESASATAGDSTTGQTSSSQSSSSAASATKRERIQYQIARSIGYSVPEKETKPPAASPSNAGETTSAAPTTDSGTDSADGAKRVNYQQTLLQYGSGFNYNNGDGEPE